MIDKATFKEVFFSYYSVLCNFSCNYTKDIQTSEDLVQDVFLDIWTSKIEIDLNKNYKSFLFTIVYRRSLMYLRTTQSHDEILRNKIIIPDTETSNVDDEEIEFYTKLDAIYVSMRQLPPKCREIFVLNKIDGVPYAEIAKRLDVSIKTVENQISKAFKILRKTLGNAQFIFFIICNLLN